MINFYNNIISIYGEKGKLWLDELPEFTKRVSLRLQLHDLKTVTNLSYNYVLSGFQGNSPIILKLGLDAEAFKREAWALKCFTNCAAVKVLLEEDEMLLLERALPGTSLKSYFSGQEPEAIEIACKIMKNLHQAGIPETHNFPHIKDWLLTLNNDWDIPPDYLHKARRLCDKLLQNSGPNVLLHGDLHHDNILQNGDDWVVIDPKGVVGEGAFEVAAFIRNPMPSLLNHDESQKIIRNRINGFAEAFGSPPKRILEWCFVQAVLAWAWAIEDGCDANNFEQLTRHFSGITFA